MNRKETTELLTDVLIKDKLSDRKYYAKEVSIDHGTTRVKRVDVMQFLPKGVFYHKMREYSHFSEASGR